MYLPQVCFSHPTVQHHNSSTNFQMTGQATAKVNKETLKSTLLVSTQDSDGCQAPQL